MSNCRRGPYKSYTVVMLNRVICCILAIGLLPACNTAQQTEEPLRLRVLSYNIKHGRGEDNTFDYKRLAGVIRAKDQAGHRGHVCRWWRYANP